MKIVFQWRRPGDWDFSADPGPAAALGRLGRWARWFEQRKAGPLPEDGRVLRVLLRMLALLQRWQDPAEPLLRRLATLRAGEPLEFVGEAAGWAGARRTGRLLRALLRRSVGKHWRGLGLHLLALPLLVLVSLLPGPNVLLYWSAYRVVNHLLSLRGAHRGLRAIELPPRPPASPPARVDLGPPPSLGEPIYAK